LGLFVECVLENQLEQGNNHDQADQKDDAYGASQKLEHCVSPRFIWVSWLGPHRSALVSYIFTFSHIRPVLRKSDKTFSLLRHSQPLLILPGNAQSETAKPDESWRKMMNSAPQSQLSDVNTLRQRARQNVENGAVTEGYSADRETVLRLLNESLATELVCVLRYKRHYYMASGL
ncbi:Uncharacterized protein ALO83_04498, partial [Pseudomonas cannabina pv. alisalensis]